MYIDCNILKCTLFHVFVTDMQIWINFQNQKWHIGKIKNSIFWILYLKIIFSFSFTFSNIMKIYIIMKNYQIFTSYNLPKWKQINIDFTHDNLAEKCLDSYPHLTRTTVYVFSIASLFLWILLIQRSFENCCFLLLLPGQINILNVFINLFFMLFMLIFKRGKKNFPWMISF